jgi:predicted glutamine amidotransferase
MCLIIKTDNPKKLQLGLLETAYLNNSDGFGVMFCNQGKLHTQKISPNSFKDIEKLWLKYKDLDVPMGLHFRFNTNGDTNRAMSHPFQILSKAKGDSRDMWVMHNGPQLPTPMIDNNKSDTHQFVKWVLRPQLSANPKLLYNAEWQEMIEDLIGSDKLLFLDGKTKEFVIYNESEGKKMDNVGWLSNTYSIQPSYTSVRDYEYDFETNKMKKKDKYAWEDDEYGYSGVYSNRSYGGYGFNRHKQITAINEDTIDKENKSIDLFGRNLIDKDYTAITHYDVDGRYSHTEYKPTSSGTKKELIPYTQIDPSRKNETKPKDNYLEDMYNGKELNWEDVCYRDMEELEDLCEENPKGIAKYIYDLVLGGVYDK